MDPLTSIVTALAAGAAAAAAEVEAVEFEQGIPFGP